MLIELLYKVYNISINMHQQEQSSHITAGFSFVKIGTTRIQAWPPARKQHSWWRSYLTCNLIFISLSLPLSLSHFLRQRVLTSPSHLFGLLSSFKQRLTSEAPHPLQRTIGALPLVWVHCRCSAQPHHPPTPSPSSAPSPLDLSLQNTTALISQVIN